LVGLCALFCTVLGLPSSVSFLETATYDNGGYGALNLSSLVVNSGPSRESKIVLGDGDNAFTIALQSAGSLVIEHRNNPAFIVDPSGQVTVFGKIVSSGVVRVDQTLNFNGVSQWMLAVTETFSQGGAGWTNGSISDCGNPSKPLLGGYGKFSGGEVSKLYRQLPTHNQIRFKATFHFIDAWTGETAYTKLEHQLVWSDIHDYMTSKNGINICGSASAAESKFGVPIDVILPHTSSSIAVTFGSTLKTSPLEASWGVSDVQIWVRQTQ